MKSTKFLCMFLYLFGASPSFGSIDVDIFDFEHSITLSGSASESDFTWVQASANCTNNSCGEFNQRTFALLQSATSNLNQMQYVDSAPKPCGVEIKTDSTSKISASSRTDFINWVNRYLATRPVFNINNPASVTNNLANGMKSVKVSALYFRCLQPNGTAFVHVQYYMPEHVVIINPPPILTGSVCTLNGQNLNLNFSSSSLNVNGISQSTTLIVSCTSGDAKDYTLKLTGSNVTNGRLNFGNGVSAQVSLNGVKLSANGPEINLQGLTSQTLPLSASLVGSASSPGVTQANGVLLLEAM